MKRATKNPLTHILPRLNAQTCPTQLSPTNNQQQVQQQWPAHSECNSVPLFHHGTLSFASQIPKQRAATRKQVNTAYQQCQMLHVPPAHKRKRRGYTSV